MPWFCGAVATAGTCPDTKGGFVSLIGGSTKLLGVKREWNIDEHLFLKTETSTALFLQQMIEWRRLARQLFEQVSRLANNSPPP